jgi:hypothetical protein
VSGLLKATYTQTDHLLGKPLPFDLARAHTLYKALFGEVEDLIKDKRLLIVPSGALNSLPFQVLVAGKPADALPSTNAGYANVAWLGTRNALTVLPASRKLALFYHALEVFRFTFDAILQLATLGRKKPSNLASSARC